MPPPWVKVADWLRPASSDSEEKLDPVAPRRKLVRTWPAGSVQIGPDATNCTLPVSDFEWLVSWARSFRRLAGKGPAALTEPAKTAACSAVASRPVSLSLTVSAWS